MPDNIQRLCPICRDGEIELTPYRSGSLSIKPSPIAVAEDNWETEIWVCPRCRYAAFFALPTPAEESRTHIPARHWAFWVSHTGKRVVCRCSPLRT